MSVAPHAWQYVLPPARSCTLPVYAYRTPFFIAMLLAFVSVWGGVGGVSSIFQSG